MEEWRNLKFCWCEYPNFDNRKIIDYSGLYEVSNLGNIRDFLTKEEIEKCLDESGYQFVVLKDKDGNIKNRKVHRIVATTFQDKCGEINEVVNHLDWDKTNNSTENLQWCTNKENLAYGGNPDRSKWKTKKKNSKETECSHIKVIPEIDWRKKVLVNY